MPTSLRGRERLLNALFFGGFAVVSPRARSRRVARRCGVDVPEAGQRTVDLLGDLLERLLHDYARWRRGGLQARPAFPPPF